MNKEQTSIYLEWEYKQELKEIQEEIQKSGNNISISELVTESVKIMLSFYRDEVIMNFKKRDYYKK